MPEPSMIAHGGGGVDFLARHFPSAPRPWCDLSTGLNPFAYPHLAVSQTAFTTLPSRALEEACRAAAADYFQADPGRLVLTPGSQAAISAVPRLFAPTKVAVLSPGYGEHAKCWTDAGHAVTPVKARDAGALDAQILIVSNPNNPDGYCWTREDLLRLHASRAGKWLVVDEAFADLRPEHSVAGAVDSHLIVYRSFGKFFGLAGLRLGFVIAPEAMAARLTDRLGPWAVSGAALEIGARAYADRDWQIQIRPRLEQAARRLAQLLMQSGVADAGGTDLFRLGRHPAAPSLFDTLCAQGLYVRRFDAVPDWLRFGLPGDDAVFARLEQALKYWAQAR